MNISFHRDGLTLRGVLTQPTTASFDLVLLMHGFTGDLGYTPDQLLYQLADRLSQAGVATIRFDFNGHGHSDGDFKNMTVLNELADAKVALDYARALPGVRRIMLLGHSQGGVVASMLAGEYHDLISKLVLLAPAATLRDDALRGSTQGFTYDPQQIPDELPIKKGLTLGGAYLRTAQTLPIYEVAAQYQGPVCLIHGMADTVVNNYASQHYDAIYHHSELHLLAGGSHTLTGAVREPVLQLVTDFVLQ